jgi:hypothetical protein
MPAENTARLGLNPCEEILDWQDAKAELRRAFQPENTIGIKVAQAILPVPGSYETLSTDKIVCATLLCTANSIAVFRFK